MFILYVVGEIGFDSDRGKVGDVGDVSERLGFSFRNEFGAVPPVVADAGPAVEPVVVAVIGLVMMDEGEVERCFPVGLPPGELGRFACRRLGVPKFLRWQGLLLS